MCEILVVKHNDKGLKFSKEAIEGALNSNSDGAGYAIFKKIKGGYDLVETEKFETTKKTLAKQVSKLKDLYIDFEWDHKNNQVVLEGVAGSELKVTYPKSMVGIKDKTPAEQQVHLEDWLGKKKINVNFDYCEVSTPPTLPVSYAWETKWGSDYQYTPVADTSQMEKIVETIYNKQDELKKDELMIIHFRLATSGEGEINTQPILGNSLLVIHNGVFTGLGDKNISDTHEFTANLETLYELANFKSKQAEAKFIEQFLNITEGWYSTFIYSKTSKQLYYFLNRASFNSFANGLMYSTKTTRFPIVTEAVTEFK